MSDLRSERDAGRKTWSYRPLLRILNECIGFGRRSRKMFYCLDSSNGLNFTESSFDDRGKMCGFFPQIFEFFYSFQIQKKVHVEFTEENPEFFFTTNDTCISFPWTPNKHPQVIYFSLIHHFVAQHSTIIYDPYPIRILILPRSTSFPFWFW